MPLTGLVVAVSMCVVSTAAAGGVSDGVVVMESVAGFADSAPLPQAVAVSTNMAMPEIMNRVDLRILTICKDLDNKVTANIL